MEQVKGVAPGFLLLPARDYDWEVQRRIEIVLPIKGSINQLLGKKVEETLNLSLNDEDDSDSFVVYEDNLLLLWEVIRVLFAQSRYPDLEDDESFNVVAVEIRGDDVVLHGQIIKSI